MKVLQDVLLETLKLSNHKIALTAPTGVAACNIRGMTIHSWSGIGIGKEPLEQLVGQVHRSREAKKRWNEADILVIDEISMLSAEMFDILLSIVGSRVRGDPRPFGGLQMILCGDFFQLPPVGLFIITSMWSLFYRKLPLTCDFNSGLGSQKVHFCFVAGTVRWRLWRDDRPG